MKKTPNTSPESDLCTRLLSLITVGLFALQLVLHITIRFNLVKNKMINMSRKLGDRL
jgi:hypothetical protein